MYHAPCCFRQEKERRHIAIRCFVHILFTRLHFTRKRDIHKTYSPISISLKEARWKKTGIVRVDASLNTTYSWHSVADKFYQIYGMMFTDAICDVMNTKYRESTYVRARTHVCAHVHKCAHTHGAAACMRYPQTSCREGARGDRFSLNTSAATRTFAKWRIIPEYNRSPFPNTRETARCFISRGKINRKE